MKPKSLVNIGDYNRAGILRILDNAAQFKANPNRNLLEHRVCATLFFEPSTRTRLSFETAVNRLCGRIIGFSDAATSSSSKGESLKDTIMMAANYADIVVMRHHLEGSARYAAEISPVPIVNAGDGANQHPTQTLLDMFSIYETQGTLENLTITIVGDLKYGRAVHSLIEGMADFSPTFNFVAPDELKISEKYKLFCDKKRITYREFTEFSPDAIDNADILYMTRVQRERFTDLMEYEKVKNIYVLRNDMLKNSKSTLRVLHPLPRVKEINQDIDDNPKAYYFQQAKNGMFVRQAVICDLLNIDIN
jgi:aspartate carbamoyltransferase catalytic subunit